MPVLHIYPARSWHDPILIAGSSTGIEALRDACQAALDQGQHGSSEVFTGDGEGYLLLVAIRTSEAMKELPTHYVDEVAEDTRDSTLRNLRGVWRDAYQHHFPGALIPLKEP